MGGGGHGSRENRRSPVLAVWFRSEIKIPDKKQGGKTNEKWEVDEKHLGEVFFCFILFLSSF